MSLGVVTAFCVLAAGAAKDKPVADPAAENRAALGKAHGGKVWVQEDAFPDPSSAELRSLLGGRAPGGDLKQKVKDGPWPLTFTAVFRKASAKGPITVQFFDKADMKQLVDQYSPANDQAIHVFQGMYDLSPDIGFNKGHRYVIKVGQLIRNKLVSYAQAEFALK